MLNIQFKLDKEQRLQEQRLQEQRLQEQRLQQQRLQQQRLQQQRLQANLIQESKMFLYLCNYFIIFTKQDRLFKDYNI